MQNAMRHLPRHGVDGERSETHISRLYCSKALQSVGNAAGEMPKSIASVLLSA